MNSGVFKRACGVTFLYIAVFILLVFAQFSKAPGFSARFGRLAVSASFPKAATKASGAPPESVRVSFEGLVIELGKTAPAVFVRADGTRQSAEPAGLEKLPNGVRILLQNSAELRVIALTAPEEGYSLVAKAPSGGAASLRLPYRITGRARLALKATGARLEAGGASYDLSLSGAVLDEAEGTLVLDVGEQRGRQLALRRLTEPAGQVTGKTRTAEGLIPQAPKNPELFRAGLDAWVAKAWAGLASSRWDATALAWRDGEGVARFSEKALAAYLAEAYRQGAFAEALARGNTIRGARRDELSYLTVPFLGNTIRKMQELEASDSVEVKRLTALVQARDPSIFEKEGLIHFLMDRSPYTLAQEVLRFAAELDRSKLSVHQAIGFLACAAESRAYLSDAENPFTSLLPVADRLVAAIRKTPEGFFLLTEEDGSVDMRLSLLAGKRFIEYGSAEGKDILVGVGQSLVESVLGLADDKGFVPARATFGAAGLERSGSLPPEELYPLVADNPYYPREVSFYRDVAPGVWAWTCAPSLKVEASASRYVYSASFPAGRSHYMAFYGLKPFSNIKLYGIDYSPDAEFEIYDASGYLYRRASSALYLKMKHKSDTERIELQF